MFTSCRCRLKRPRALQACRVDRATGGAFFQGVFATILATPCTAPFLGTASAFAFAQPGWATFLIFLFIGLGMALPYLLLAVNPKWLRYLPKPGAWMLRLKQCMGFLLAGTLLWLVWILGQMRGADAIVRLGATPSADSDSGVDQGIILDPGILAAFARSRGHLNVVCIIARCQRATDLSPSRAGWFGSNSARQSWTMRWHPADRCSSTLPRIGVSLAKRTSASPLIPRGQTRIFETQRGDAEGGLDER